jgi:hypothetical protein
MKAIDMLPASTGKALILGDPARICPDPKEYNLVDFLRIKGRVFEKKSLGVYLIWQFHFISSAGAG